MTVPLIVLAAVLVALLVAGATLVLVGLVAIGQHRADGRMRLRMRALEQRLAALDRVNTDLRAANTAPLTRRSLECERERWSDLINPAVPEDRAGRYVPTDAERVAWEDLDRRLEES
jgi:hypothetical protein